MKPDALDGREAAHGVGREALIYSQRFSEAEERSRRATWQVLVDDFFSSYIQGAEVIVDIGAGDGHFLRNVKARRRIAVDLSSHVLALEKEGIEVLQTPAAEFARLLDEPADVIFMSNFLEHLPNKKAVLDVLEESRQALRPAGMLLILQPNIRYAGATYWDYIDHQTALTERSLAEALDICGFRVVRLIPRFLPYTARSVLGRAAGANLVRWYLRMPFIWRFLGAQTFAAAVPK